MVLSDCRKTHARLDGWSWGIWVVAYAIGFGLGILYPKDRTKIISSTVLGYMIATTLHLMFLGVFPGTPTNSFDTLRDFVFLKPPPIYYTFITLVMLFGPVVIGLATFTGTLVSTEISARRENLQLHINSSAALFAIIFPLSLMIMTVGLLNYNDFEEVEATTLEFQGLVRTINTEIGSVQDREPVPTLLFLHLDLLTSITLNAALAILCGLLIGIKRTIADSKIAALSTFVGFSIYIMLMLILLDIIAPNSTATISYESIYNDRIDSMRAPELVAFAVIWFIPPLISGTTAFITHMVMNTQHVTPAIASE